MRPQTIRFTIRCCRLRFSVSRYTKVPKRLRGDVLELRTRGPARIPLHTTVGIDSPNAVGSDLHEGGQCRGVLRVDEERGFRKQRCAILNEPSAAHVRMRGRMTCRLGAVVVAGGT